MNGRSPHRDHEGPYKRVEWPPGTSAFGSGAFRPSGETLLRFGALQIL